MRTYFFLILVLLLAGCDGARGVRILFDLSKTQGTETNMTVDIRNQLYAPAFQIVDEVARNYRMEETNWGCTKYDDLCRSYKVDHVWLSRYIHAGIFNISLIEIGPPFKTPKYKAIERELTQQMTRRYGSDALSVFNSLF